MQLSHGMFQKACATKMCCMRAYCYLQVKSLKCMVLLKAKNIILICYCVQFVLLEHLTSSCYLTVSSTKVCSCNLTFCLAFGPE